MLEPVDDRAPRRAQALAQVVLTLATVGLGTSALLLYLHLFPGSGACGPEGGCDMVRTSAWSMVAGIPLPWLGVAYFGVLTAALLAPALRKRWLLAMLGLGGLASGVTLLVLQAAVIGALCPYCVVVDACSIGAGLCLAPALAVPRLRLAGRPVIGAFGLGAAVPVVLLAIFTTAEPPAVPSGPAPGVIADAQAEDRATIVEFIDFECPFCRRQHARMAEVLAGLAGEGEEPPVQLVYKHLPLRIHANAREAARFACCAEEQGRGGEMVDALFSRDALSTEACHECASELGLDDAALRECLDSTRPDARLDADAQDARAAAVRRLPTCFVGEQRFEGLQEEATLRAAIEQAMAKATTPT
jgi:protein-disulfide isomerase/uncharacterized membrane protein